jgi:hypothetical protein
VEVAVITHTIFFTEVEMFKQLTCTEEALELARKLFPFPKDQKEQMEDEVASCLPFASFGWTGGYGVVRRRLANAIRDGDMEAAEKAYHELIGQSIDEGMEELTEDSPDGVPLFSCREECADSMRTFVDAFGNLF